MSGQQIVFRFSNSHCAEINSFWTEYADVSETILKSSGPFNIAKALNDPAVKPYVKSLTVCAHNPACFMLCFSDQKSP